MKEWKKAALSVVMLLAAVALFLAGGPFGGRLERWQSGLLFGLAGALLGLGGSRLILWWVLRGMTEAERREAERGERDERNAAIRQKAAQSSWYWTLYLLWGLFLVSLVTASPLYIALSAGTIVLHCVFYMVNMGRWARRM